MKCTRGVPSNGSLALSPLQTWKHDPAARGIGSPSAPAPARADDVLGLMLTLSVFLDSMELFCVEFALLSKRHDFVSIGNERVNTRGLTSSLLVVTNCAFVTTARSPTFT